MHRKTTTYAWHRTVLIIHDCVEIADRHVDLSDRRVILKNRETIFDENKKTKIRYKYAAICSFSETDVE